MTVGYGWCCEKNGLGVEVCVCVGGEGGYTYTLTLISKIRHKEMRSNENNHPLHHHSAPCWRGGDTQTYGTVDDLFR